MEIFFSYICFTLLKSLKRFSDCMTVDKEPKAVTLNPRWMWLILLFFLKLE